MIGSVMRLRSLFIRAASVLGIVAAWWLITDVVPLFSPIILPSPVDVAKAAVDLARDGGLKSGGLYEANLFGHILISVRRVFLAWLAAVLVALPLGAALGAWPAASRYTDLTIRIVSQVPPIAYIPLAIVWFGLGEAPILFIIFIGALWSMLTSVESGIQSVPPILLRAARSQGANELQVFRRVILPAAMPYIFTGMRVSFGLAWV
jgi:NitT/TauT family transport system permease protein